MYILFFMLYTDPFHGVIVALRVVVTEDECSFERHIREEFMVSFTWSIFLFCLRYAMKMELSIGT